MATAQINARIDASLKASGDQALSNAGYTPTRAIRALWGFADANKHDRGRLRKLFELLEGHIEQPEANTPTDESAHRRVKHALEGPHIIEKALDDMGISSISTDEIPYDELLEQAYIDKMSERGTLL